MRSRSTKLFALLALLVAAVGTAAAHAQVTQVVGTLQVSVDGKLAPKKLPREGKAPISVSVGWNIGTTDGAPPPKLKQLKIEINRNGVLDPTGLPVCPYEKIQPASTSRALSNCRSSLVGRGKFTAIVGLEGQESYAAAGEMLVFNGEKGGKPVLYGQIYSALPFANSFVITFKVSKIAKGTYGTALSATLPATLRAWGNLTSIEMTLSRKYGFEGKQRSYLSAGCPAPKGFTAAVYSMARTSFGFVGAPPITSVLTDDCKVRP